LEGKTAVAIAVIMGALERTPGIAQQESAGRHQRRAVLAAINKTPRQHKRYRRRPELFFEWTIIRPAGTHDVEHSPSLSVRDWPGFGRTRRTTLRLAGESQG